MNDFRIPHTILNNGVSMPWLGLGTSRINQPEALELFTHAIQLGYRSIDTAELYKNEHLVGEAVRHSGTSRSEFFLTSKVWEDDQGYDQTLRAFETSLQKLGTDYLDLYLIHWPTPSKGLYLDTWKALERLYEEKLVRAIGVSNFSVMRLQEVLTICNIVPAVNQVEVHPRFTQQDLHSFCRAQRIQLEAWGPLQHGRIFNHPVLIEIAEKYEKTVAQIVLRWHYQRQIVIIPKSTNLERLQSNMDIFSFTITDEDLQRISNLNQNERTGSDPDTL